MTLKGVTCYTCGKRDAIETDADSATVVAHFERRGWQVGNTRPESTLRTRCPDCKRDGLLRPDEAADRYRERLGMLSPSL